MSTGETGLAFVASKFYRLPSREEVAKIDS